MIKLICVVYWQRMKFVKFMCMVTRTLAWYQSPRWRLSLKGIITKINLTDISLWKKCCCKKYLSSTILMSVTPMTLQWLIWQWLVDDLISGQLDMLDVFKQWEPHEGSAFKTTIETAWWHRQYYDVYADYIWIGEHAENVEDPEQDDDLWWSIIWWWCMP